MRAPPTVGMCQEGIPGDKGNEGHRTGERSHPTLGLAQNKLDMGTNCVWV